MSRLMRLTAADIHRLHRTRASPGVLLHYRFVQDPDADPKDWVLSDWADALRGLGEPRSPKTFEIWATSTQKHIATWAPSKANARQLAQLMNVFNPEIEPVLPVADFPALRSGCVVRVGRMRPRRNSHYPIEHRFSRQTQRTLRYGAGLAGQVSPIHHLLSSIPPIPEGSALVIQVVFHQNAYYWRYNPWTHLGILPLGFDEEALEEKRRHRSTYYADVRFLEIHADKTQAKSNLIRSVAHAFGIYEWPRANSLTYRPLRGWGRRRVTSFVDEMRNRLAKRHRLRRRNRPHFTDRELAALIHPPPAGTQIPDLAYTRVSPSAASSTTRARAHAYQQALRDLEAQASDERGGRGRIRQPTNQEVREQLRRLQQQGGQP